MMRDALRRLLFGVSLILLALALVSCADQRSILKEKATNYLDSEIKGRWENQFGLYNSLSQRLIFQPYKSADNPLRPAVIDSYQLTDIALEGSRARVSFTATISTQDAYTGIKPGDYDLTLYFVDQQGNWMVDELKSRAEWIARLKGQPFADLWIRELKAQQYNRPQ